ncbi:MAG: hypothetical protein C4332_03030 [Meiothermus sp.]
MAWACSVSVSVVLLRVLWGELHAASTATTAAKPNRWIVFIVHHHDYPEIEKSNLRQLEQCFPLSQALICFSTLALEVLPSQELGFVTPSVAQGLHGLAIASNQRKQAGP